MQEDFHEKLIVAYAPLENADPELLSLFWLAPMEWNLAPPRRANTIIMTDANGRTGLDYAQAANHDKDADWNVVGGNFSEDTTAKGSDMVNICDQARICMGNTWRNGEPTAFTPMSPSGHRVDYIAFGQERLEVAEIETCYELGKGLQLSSQYDHVPVHVRVPPARRWRRDKDRDPSCPRWNHAALRWAMRGESLSKAYRDSVEQALTTSHIVNSDLPLDDWYGSVMGITQQVASHHFGVKSTSPRRHWMTPEAWNDIMARQAQIRSLWSTGAPFATG